MRNNNELMLFLVVERKLRLLYVAGASQLVSTVTIVETDFRFKTAVVSAALWLSSV